MRLITRKLWRAFPELDRFDDERCERFVETALRAKWPRLVRGLLSVLAACAVAIASIALAIAISRAWGGVLDHSTLQPLDSIDLLAIGLVIGGLLTGGVVGMLARDQLLRRRVRRFIHVRGKCPQCRYILLGLPVPDSLRLTCPECGHEMEIDPALAEPSNEGGVRRVIRAEEDRWLPKWVTPRMARAMRRGSLTLLILAALTLGGWWGWSEWDVRRQAKLAASERLGFSVVAKLSLELNPPDDGSPDGWALLDAAVEIMKSAELKVESSPDALKDEQNQTVYADYSWLGNAPAPERGVDVVRAAERGAEMARRALQEIAETGGMKSMGDLAAARRAARAWPMVGQGQGAIGLIPMLSGARQLCLLNAGRMSAAQQAGNLPEYLAALRVEITLAWMCEREPLLMTRLVGISIESMLYRRVRKTLMDHPDKRWIDAIVSTLGERPLGSVAASKTIEGERSIVLDTIAFMFSDPQQVQLKVAAMLAAGTSGVPSPAIGTYIANRDIANRLFDKLQEQASKPCCQRDMSFLDSEKVPYLINLFMPGIVRSMRSFDQVAMERAALSIMLAIERYRVDHGSYPKELGSLVPIYLPDIPADAFTGLPLRYVLTDPSTDSQGRGYWLYSIGADKEDNGGKSRPAGSPDQMQVLWNPKQKGYDLIFNDRDR